MINDYWYIGTVGGGYKVDLKTYCVIVEAIKNNKRYIEFEDIFDTVCGLVIAHISDWHHSTPEARKQHNEFSDLIEKEKEKPEWDQ